MINTEVETILKDKRRFIESFFHIQTKQQALQRIKLNKMQRHLLENLSYRNLGLKARQMGFTTGILASYFYDVISIPNTRMVVVSHEELATQLILAKVHVFYDNMPKGFRPAIHHDSSYQMSFPKLGSMVYIGTAGAKVFGFGDTIHRFLGTEVSRWSPERAEQILTGVEEAVPDTGLITLESTAFGEGGVFHERCVSAMQGEGFYKLHFFPWWWDEEYSYEEGDDRALLIDRGPIILTPDEELLSDKHGLSHAQIRWRRRKISDRKELFWQEYPEDPQTCFLSSSRAVWDGEIFKEMLLHCRPPRTVNDWGVQIWQGPRAGELYVVGVDPAEGAPATDDESGFIQTALKTSKCALSIINARTLELVASWEGYLEPNELAQLAAAMGKEYNTAMLTIERNNHGHAVLNTLQNWLGYPNLYRYRDPVDKGEKRLGWPTTAKTRPQLIANFKALLDSRSLMGVIWDEVVIFQGRNFRYLPKGKTGMPPKLHDDKLFSYLIALETRVEALMAMAVSTGKIQHYGRKRR